MYFAELVSHPFSERLVAELLVPEYTSCRRSPRTSPLVMMDGRTWHTSGSNTTEAEDRALVLAFHSMPYLRPMMKFHAALSPDKHEAFTGALRSRLCLDWHAEGVVVDPFLEQQ